jgi:dynein heavy chain
MRTFRSLLKDFESDEFYQSFPELKNKLIIIENKFVFSYIWSLGGSLTTDYRKTFDIFIKKLTNGDIPVP